MKRLLKIGAMLAVCLTANSAFAYNGNGFGLEGCSGASRDHVVSVQKNGFFPSKLFVCPGDRVYFENNSGYWAKFNQSWGTNTDLGIFNSYWMSNGSMKGPLNVNAGMGMRIENLDLWNVSNYTYRMEFAFGSPDLRY